MSPEHKEQARDFLEIISVCQGALRHIHFYLAILILTAQISTSYGHPIGTYSQDLPVDPSSISGSPSSSTYVDSLSVMFLRNVPVAIVVNSKGQIVGTLSSESFKATAQQTHAKIPSLTVKTQSAKSVAVKSTSVSKTNKDVAVSAATGEITVVKPNDLTKTRPSTPGKVMAVGKAKIPSLTVKTQSATAKSVVVKSTSISKTNKDLAVSAATKEITVVKPNDLTKTRTSTPGKVMAVGKAISVKEAAAKVIVSQNSSSLKAKAINTNEPVAVLNNSAGAGSISAKTAQATSPPAKMMESTGLKSATNITTTTIAAGNVTSGTQWSASTTFSPANTTVLLANTTVLPTTITSPTLAAAAFAEGLEYGEDYTTTPAPAPILMGEGGEPLEPEEVVAAEPVELR